MAEAAVGQVGERPTRVLLEHQNPRVLARQAATLAAAGFAVETCAGPSGYADGVCPLTSRGRCAKAAAADVVLAGLPLHDIGVYIALRVRYPRQRVLLAMTEAEREAIALPALLDQVATIVPRNEDGDDLVAAVRESAAAPLD